MSDSAPQDKDFSFWAVVFTVFICMLFGANAVAIKISLKGLGVFTTAGIRFGIAAIAIFIWSRITGRSLDIKKEQIFQLMVISVIFTAQLSLFYLGLSKSNASRGTLLVNFQPFFTLFLAHFFIPGDRITKRKIMGLLMGFFGVAFVFLEKKGLKTHLNVGDLMILAAAFLWACNAVYTKRVISSFQPFQIVLFPMIFSVPFFFLGGVLWDGHMIGFVDAEIIGAMASKSDCGDIRLCGLEQHVEKIRRRCLAFFCFCYAHHRRFAGRADLERTDNREYPHRLAPDRFGNYSDPL